MHAILNFNLTDNFYIDTNGRWSKINGNTYDFDIIVRVSVHERDSKGSFVTLLLWYSKS